MRFLSILDRLWFVLLPLILSLELLLYPLLLVISVIRSEPERAGFGPGTRTPVVWLHGASIGEWNALEPLVQHLQHMPLAGSYTSSNGRSHKVLAAVQRHGYLPFDLWPALMLRVLRWRPTVVVIAEVDLWPTWLLVLRWLRVPVVWVNARTDRSMGEVLQYMPRLYRFILSTVVYAHCVDERTMKLLSRILDAEVETGPNLKWARESVVAMREPQEKIGLMLASVHTDEIALLRAGVAWLASGPANRRLVIAPRYLGGLNEIRDIVVAACMEHKLAADKADLVFVDRYGVMDRYYRTCLYAVVGGSFNGVGGHNPVEPAVYGCHTIVGPDMHAQRPGTQLLERCELLHTVNDASDLAALLSRLPLVPADTSRLAQALTSAQSCASHISETIIEIQRR